MHGASMYCYVLSDCIAKCRSLRMVENTIVTGSDDWTARVWSVSSGACETVLACHSGAVTNVEYCPADKGIVTGKFQKIRDLYI